jgi:hypothetical protein
MSNATAQHAAPAPNTLMWTPTGEGAAERVRVLEPADLPGWFRVRCVSDRQSNIVHGSNLYYARPLAR